MQTLIVAEVGKNFITRKEIQTVKELLLNAQELAKSARDSGASIVKFQCHAIDEIEMRDKSRHEWIHRNIASTPYRAFWYNLKHYCDSIDIEFLCTPMSLKAAEMINPMVGKWKIGSGNTHDIELLKFVASTNKPVYLSSGMTTLVELDRAVKIFKNVNVTVLHCVSEYPLKDERANLTVINDLAERYPYLEIGYSDHTEGTLVPAIAVARGAIVIEKHFTLDKKAWGPDHFFSLNPKEFRSMVSKIKWVEKVLGHGEKKMSKEETELRKIYKL